ncbi:hypothetical protein [Devosia sp.]|uniref:hypothetical protein n=1 Tax=Devosia sp. TaxID=1871048 RepID=UPI0026230249|nr:hypothetical protein [Devosia sp.]
MSTRKPTNFNTNLSHPEKRRAFAQSAAKLGGFWRSIAQMDVDKSASTPDDA